MMIMIPIAFLLLGLGLYGYAQTLYSRMETTDGTVLRKANRLKYLGYSVSAIAVILSVLLEV